MTQEYDRLFAAILGKGKWDEARCRICGWPLKQTMIEGCTADSCSQRPVPVRRADTLVWSPSLDGEITKEVRDWFAKEMPEWWTDYCDECFVLFRYDKRQAFESVNTLLSITNLAQYILDNYKEMFFEECPDGFLDDEGYCDCKHSPRRSCTVTGLIVKPQFAEAVRVIEEGMKK
jgi:hypothetical protein